MNKKWTKNLFRTYGGSRISPWQLKGKWWEDRCTDSCCLGIYRVHIVGMIFSEVNNYTVFVTEVTELNKGQSDVTEWTLSSSGCSLFRPTPPWEAHPQMDFLHHFLSNNIIQPVTFKIHIIISSRSEWHDIHFSFPSQTHCWREQANF